MSLNSKNFYNLIKKRRSVRDFKGKSTSIRDGNYGIVLKRIGRPLKFSAEKEYDILDVYDNFIDGYSLCDLAITRDINPSQSCQIGIKNIFGFTNPEYITNISGRLYYISFKIDFN